MYTFDIGSTSFVARSNTENSNITRKPFSRRPTASWSFRGGGVGIQALLPSSPSQLVLLGGGTVPSWSFWGRGSGRREGEGGGEWEEGRGYPGSPSQVLPAVLLSWSFWGGVPSASWERSHGTHVSQSVLFNSVSLFNSIQRGVPSASWERSHGTPLHRVGQTD